MDSVGHGRIAGPRRLPHAPPRPAAAETTPELKSHFDFFLGTLGFTPNSVLTMQRKPKLVQAFAQLNAANFPSTTKVEFRTVP